MRYYQATLTVEEKLLVYKRLLARYELGDVCYMCLQLKWDAQIYLSQKTEEPVTFFSIDENATFPEIFEHQPEYLDISGGFWPLNTDGMNKRIEVLKSIISKLEKQTP